MHSLKKKKSEKVQSSAVVLCLILSAGQNVCVWQYCHNLRKVMFYRDIYINIIHIYKNVYCMDMHWMFAQNLEERAALNKMTVKLVSSAENWGKKCQKKLNFCVKIMCELQMFSNRDCVMGEYFLHLFLIVIFLYIFTERWCKCIILRFQCCLLARYVNSFCWLMSKTDYTWQK